MMKFIAVALLAVCASAADTEAPVISLDMTLDNYHSGTSAAYKQDRTNLPASHAMVKHCEYGESCVLPVAKAWDHHDGPIDSVDEEIKQFVESKPNQQFQEVDKDVAKESVTNERGEYVFTYSATDSSSNSADEVMYALIVTDHEAPKHAPSCQNCEPYTLSPVYERSPADSDYPYLKDDNYFIDNYDTNSNSLFYEVRPNGANTWVDLTDDNAYPSNYCNSGTVHFKVSDWAYVFGEHNMRNPTTMSRTYTVRDSTPPSIPFTKARFNELTNYADLPNHSDDFIECNKQNAVIKRTTGSWSTIITDDGCACDDASPLAHSTTHGSCKWTHSLACGDDPDCKTHMNATITVTVTATDSASLTKSEIHNFEIIDTTPPEINYSIDLADNIAKAGVGQHRGNSARGAQNGGDSIRGGNDVVKNMFLESTSYEYSEVIQHSAGFTGDAEQLQALASKWGSCTDDCQEIPIHNKEWFDVTSATTPVTCDELATRVAYSANAEKTGQDINSDMIRETHYGLEKVGTFVLLYTCKDDSGNESPAKCRTIINEDHTRPVIHLRHTESLETEDVFVAAQLAGDYVDAGATCSDQVDGDLTQNVIVSGSVVNLATPDTYRITYSCTDTAGNTADHTGAIRTVIVEDKICPTCVVIGETTKTIEASFPYTDEQANCYDNIDAPTATPKLEASLEESNLDTFDVEKTGTYRLTYRMTDNEGNSATNCPNGQSCTDPTDTAQSTQCETAVRTVIVEDSIAPIISLNYGLMAESSSVNGWAALAMASAAAGVALLGFAASRNHADTAVPV